MKDRALRLGYRLTAHANIDTEFEENCFYELTLYHDILGYVVYSTKTFGHVDKAEIKSMRNWLKQVLNS